MFFLVFNQRRRKKKSENLKIRSLNIKKCYLSVIRHTKFFFSFDFLADYNYVDKKKL